MPNEIRRGRASWGTATLSGQKTGPHSTKRYPTIRKAQCRIKCLRNCSPVLRLTSIFQVVIDKCRLWVEEIGLIRAAPYSTKQRLEAEARGVLSTICRNRTCQMAKVSNIQMPGRRSFSRVIIIRICVRLLCPTIVIKSL